MKATMSGSLQWLSTTSPVIPSEDLNQKYLRLAFNTVLKQEKIVLLSGPGAKHY